MIDDGYGHGADYSSHGWNVNDSARFQLALDKQIQLNRIYREMIDNLEKRITRLENLEIISRQILLSKDN